MKTIIIILLIFLVLSVSFVFLASNIKTKPTPTDTGVYQGPVQEGYDEQLFRETGRYEKLKEDSN